MCFLLSPMFRLYSDHNGKVEINAKVGTRKAYLYINLYGLQVYTLSFASRIKNDNILI